MRAEVQHGVSREILRDIAVEGRKGMGGREATLEKQPHRVALVAEGWLQTHEDIAERGPEHEDAAAVGLMATGCRSPLRLDLREPGLACHVVLGGNTKLDVRRRAEARRIAAEQALAQGVDRDRNLDPVALALHGVKGVPQRAEHRQERGRAGGTGVRWEVEQHDRDLAILRRSEAQGDLLRHAAGQHAAALEVGPHGAMAPLGRCARATAEHDRRRGAVDFGDRHHHRGFDRRQARVRSAPFFHRLELDRLALDAGHVELRQHGFGRRRIVVGWAADQRETGQANQGIDRRSGAVHEVSPHGGPAVETAGEGGHDLEALGFQGSDHAVVMTGVAGQNVGAHDQQADRSAERCSGSGKVLDPRGDPGRQGRVVEADIRIFDRQGRRETTHEVPAGAAGIAADQKPDHAGEIVVRPREPELHGEEISPHVLGRAGHETQDLRQAAQHGHLLGTGVRIGRRATLVVLATFAAQTLQERHHAAAARTVHVELADAGKAHDLAGRHEAQHRIAVRPPRHEGRHDGFDVGLEKHHIDEDDVALGDIGAAALERAGIAVPVRRGVEGDREAGYFRAQLAFGRSDGAGHVTVERQDDDPDRHHISAH